MFVQDYNSLRPTQKNPKGNINQTQNSDSNFFSQPVFPRVRKNVRNRRQECLVRARQDICVAGLSLVCKACKGTTYTAQHKQDKRADIFCVCMFMCMSCHVFHTLSHCAAKRLWPLWIQQLVTLSLHPIKHKATKLACMQS